MKRKQFKSLCLSKSVVSNLNSQKVKGGISGACTSSVNRLECKLGCPETVYAPC
ncbi:hypothetical protein [Kordia sp.]|uniref:hypothetical protein n=1 Tax=Kordia sp. TaxID=1965332 RepID=UPI003D292EA4